MDVAFALLLVVQALQRGPGPVLAALCRSSRKDLNHRLVALKFAWHRDAGWTAQKGHCTPARGGLGRSLKASFWSP